MLEKLIEKLGAKFTATTPGCSIVKIARLNNAFLEVFQPQASPIEGQSLRTASNWVYTKKKFDKSHCGYFQNYFPPNNSTKSSFECPMTESSSALLLCSLQAVFG